MKTHLASCLRSFASVAALTALAAAALPQSAHAQAVTVTTLANFDGTNGAFPYAALTLARDGNFYGATNGNPDNSSEVGTVFKLTPAGSLTTLFSFTGTNGSFPVGKNPNGLIEANNGNFYGTTVNGGTNSDGTLFVITPAGALTVLHQLNTSVGDGAQPNRPIQGRDGNLYGTTFSGGLGTIFAASLGGAYGTQTNFNDQNVRNPAAALLQASDGSFYGTASGGGNNGGAVFKFAPGGIPTALVTFTGPNGAAPQAELIQATDGNFYGTTQRGGSASNGFPSGTVFRLTPSGQLTTLVTFDGTNGAGPVAALLQGRDGNFYGTTSGGGLNNGGTVFKLTPAGVLTTLFNFYSTAPSPPDNGSSPRAALIQGPDGDFYGTTLFGGSGGRGTVFRLNISPNGVQEATLGNIATRLPVGANDNALIGGFIVTGTNPKRVIIRGIGPSLSVPGALADPTLELRDSTGQLIAFNDDWKDTQQAAIEQTGIPPSDQFESAIVASLTANNSSYTAILRGKNGSTGRGVVEVYDLDQSVDSRLANISTRGLVGTGDNALIGGFISGPNTKVIVRAIGPSLAQSGVKNPLLDPTLELRNSNGTIVRSNNDWKDTQQEELQASGIAPTNDRESALVVTLTADSYTAVVRGLGDTTGIGAVEVYDVK